MKDLYCIKCYSKKIKHSIKEQGYSLKKAAIGGILLGPFGLLFGLSGKDKRSKCLECEECLAIFSLQEFNSYSKKLEPASRLQFLCGVLIVAGFFAIPLSWSSLSYIESFLLSIIPSLFIGKIAEMNKKKTLSSLTTKGS